MKEFFKRIDILLTILILILFIIISIRSYNKPSKVIYVNKECQEIFNICTKLNTDLGNIQALPKNDKMFEQFSKAQRINTIKYELNHWIEVYNNKSKIWGKSFFHNDFPKQLTINQFSNYNIHKR